MNGQHLRAFFWLRWRLFVNQMRRGGVANTIVVAILAIGGILLSLMLMLGAFALGFGALGPVSPVVLLYVWDGLVVAFLFSWITGLFSELQRSEALSIEKFLHLPVSLTGVFALNYLSSLFSLNLALFVPTMVGLTLGLVVSRGPAMLLILPLLIGFLLMVTALTYQFQGWLASLMVDKRRRRTIIVVATFLFILICQLPNLLNFLKPWDSKQQDALIASVSREQAEEIAGIVNLVLPPGWLPLGVMGLAEGNLVPALLGTLGLTLIGAASLWRGYRTTVRLYTGDFTAGKGRPTPAVAGAVTPPNRSPAVLLERKLPWMSEAAAAIALAGFRSLTRAPEAKMLLLTPIILVVVVGGLSFRSPVDMPEDARPLIAYGAMSMILFTLVQLVGNQFGFDRAGFRVFVLSPASRADILLGKNLAVAPLALGLCAAGAVLVQVFFPMRIDRFLALVPQLVSMYLLFCMMANGLSIFAPMPMAAGTLKPINPRLVSILIGMAFTLALPMVMAPTLLPFGIEFAVQMLAEIEGVPIGLALALVECAAIVAVYRVVLNWQGDLLHMREQQILEIVTTKTE